MLRLSLTKPALLAEDDRVFIIKAFFPLLNCWATHLIWLICQNMFFIGVVVQ